METQEIIAERLSSFLNLNVNFNNNFLLILIKTIKNTFKTIAFLFK